MVYIVPAADQAPDHFFVPLPTGRTRIALPLESNTMAVLTPLGKWLGLMDIGHRKKADLVATLSKSYLSLLPMEDALAAWPALGTVFNTMTAAADSLDRNQIQQWLQEMRALLTSIRNQTPQFLPHALKICRDLEDHARRVAEEERIAIAKERAAPAWWDAVLTEAPAGPHFKITVQEDEQGHDGYCSGTEEDEMEIVSSKTRTVFLPAGDWSFDKTEWREGAEGHCCCGADVLCKIMAIESVE